MPVFCCISNYLEEDHDKYYAAQENACVEVDNYPIVLIPSDKKLAEIAKLQKSGDLKDFREAQMQLLAYCIHAKPKDPDADFKKTPIGSNGVRQIIKFAKFDDKGFTVLSGPDYKTEAECVYNTDFIPMLSSNPKKEGQQTYRYVATIKKGDVATNGNSKNDQNMEQAVKLMGGAYEAIQSNNLADKKRAFEKILNDTKQSNGSKNFFVSTIAGLISWLGQKLADKSDANYKDYHRACVLIKSFCSYDALGLYLALFQPFGKHQFLAESITSSDWSGAERSASGAEYCDILKSIDNMCDCECCESCGKYRKEAIAKMSDSDSGLLTKQDQAKAIKGVYDEYVEKMFGSDFLESSQKVWADELLFRSHTIFDDCCDKSGEDINRCIDRIVDMAKDNFPGNDYKSEGLFGDPNYWDKIAQPHSWKSKQSPIVFLESPFFLKCCFTDCPKCCEYVSKCDNPVSAKAKSYFMIHGGSFA